MDNSKKVKKQSVVYIIICIAMTFCTSGFTYKQRKILLNNDYGVPFCKDEFDDCYVDGFDVDENGNFYFLGGDNAILTCFMGDSLIFHKEFTEFKSNQIYLFDDQLYIFDYMFEKNNLFTLDKNNGDITSEYQNIVKNRVNSFLFRDTCLIIEIFNNQNKIDMNTQLGFTLFNLKGRFLKQVSNPYNLPNILNPGRVVQYLGTWENNFVYWDYDVDRKLYKFILKDIRGEVISNKNIEEKFFGRSFYGNPIGHKKIRNDTIYILGHDEKNVIITELPIKELFNQ